MELIKDIATLRRYVKINASTNWDTISSFVIDAQEKYITPYFGEALLEAVATEQTDELRSRILRALGPFSLALATHELSINFGEAGHTVTRTTTLAPASDAKIKNATDSLLERGWHNLDRALRYLYSNKQKYVGAIGSENLREIGTVLFDGYDDFQEKGMIDINNSPLTFSRLRMFIKRIEQSEALKMLPSGFVYDENDSVFMAMQAYTASRVAELQTNANADNNLKDAPPIQLLSDGTADSKNYYATQSSYWRNEIIQLLIKEGAIEDNREIRVNGPDKTIFFAGGKKI